MRVLIIEDHQITRIGLKVVIREVLPDAIIDEAEDGVVAGKFLKENKYKLCLMDINVPRSEPNQLIMYIKSSQPEIRLLVVSMNSESVYGISSMKNGADGYFSKANGYDDLKVAIRRMLENRKYMSDVLLQSLIESKAVEPDQNPLSRLSDKELNVARFICQGLSTKEIAVKIGLTNSSVSTYKAKVFEKLQVTNVIELSDLFKIYQ